MLEYPISNAFSTICLIEALHAALTARHPTKCDVINYVKLFPTYNVAIFLTFFNETSCYKSKCIRISTDLKEAMLSLPIQKDIKINILT